MPLLVPGRAIFYHAVKCGGTFTRDVLIAHAGARYVGGGHDPVHLQRPEDPFCAEALTADLPRLAVIRDPYSWYASLYRYAVQGSNHEALRAWGRGSMDWEAVLYGWTHPWEVGPSAPMDQFGVVFEPVEARMERAYLLRSGYGLWSWAMGYFYSGLPAGAAERREGYPLAGVMRHASATRPADVVLDASAPGGLAPQLAAWLGVGVATVEARRAEGRPNRNASDPGIATPWSPETRGWVAAADGLLATVLGYDP